MSLEILTSTAAGGSLAPAAFSSTTTEGAGSGQSFGALLDEQTGADENLCPQIVGEPVAQGCERAAETAQGAPGSSLSALGVYAPFSSGSADPAVDSPPQAAADDDDDDSADGEVPLDIVPVPLASVPTLADLLASVETSSPGDPGLADALDASLKGSSESGATNSPAPSAGATVAQSVPEQTVGISVAADQSGAGATDPAVTATVPDTAAAVTSNGTAQPPRADARRPVAGDDLRQLVEAALRARIAEAFPQAGAARLASNSVQSGAPAVPQEATGTQPLLTDAQTPSDAASRTRAAVAEAVAQAFSGSADSGAPPDQDGGAGRQPLMSAADREALLGARTAPIGQPVAQFAATLSSAAGVAPTSAAQGATIPNEAHVASSIVQSMRLQMRDGIGTAVVHLEPDFLGPVTINLRVAGGAVTASLHAENPQVRAWIEANEPMLRQALSDQGLSLDRLLVSAERPSEDQEASQGRRPPQEEPAPRRQPKPDESRTFEVIV